MMKVNRRWILCMLAAVVLCGCGGNEETVSDTTGYYFSVFPEEKPGEIRLSSWDDEFNFQVESAGDDREFAVSFFCDYEQIPMEINGSVCQTFYVDGNDSGEYSFSLGREPEEGQIHKLTAIMTAYSDVLTADQDDVPFSTKDSIILNFDLIIGDAKDMTTFSHKAETEEELYDTQGSGIVINTFTDEIASKVPQKEVHVNAGEELTLQYHAGGYTENDFLIFVTAGYEQMRLNGENYLYFEHLPSRKMAAGFCQMSTPDTPGRYEVMGYVIPDPFSDSGVSDEHADESYRFTLVVE